MRSLVRIAILAFCVMAHAQEDCKPEVPCAVTVDRQTGRTTVTRARPASGLPVTQAPDAAKNLGNDVYLRLAGPEALSLEETALSFFEHVASADASYPGAGKPFDPQNVMWNRGELTDAEAAEVLALARHLGPPGEPRGEEAKWLANRSQMCQELASAQTTDAQIAALEGADNRATAQAVAAGKEILDQLSSGTRSSVMKVLTEYRTGMEIGRPNWRKFAASKPDALVKHRAQICAGVK